MRFRGRRPDSGDDAEWTPLPESVDVDDRHRRFEVAEFKRNPIRWIFIGDQGPRAGWSVILFVLLWTIFAGIIGFLVQLLIPIQPQAGALTPGWTFVNELASLQAFVGAAGVCALIERRNILDYNVGGPSPLPNFLKGLAFGFCSLLGLALCLYVGGWLHVEPATSTWGRAIGNGLAWGAVFLVVGAFEEGTFRGYVQYTFTRGANFWWGLATVVLTCVVAATHRTFWGVGIVAAIGLIPCLWLRVKRSPSEGFWTAAWMTSTLFAFIHASNGGESWAGVFDAGFVGYLFCISVRVTGSVWWAVGYHAAWDWAQTFFLGTADSGHVATDHFLTSTPSGPTLLSGGAAGPEGSLLSIVVLSVAMAGLLLARRRRLQPNPRSGV